MPANPIQSLSTTMIKASIWAGLLASVSAFLLDPTLCRSSALGRPRGAKKACDPVRKGGMATTGHVQRALMSANPASGGLNEWAMLGRDDVEFERYVGSVSYTESVTMQGDGPTLTDEGTFRASDFTATVGTATVRVFQGKLTNIQMLTRGDDVRVTLKEYPQPNDDDGVDLADNEARAIAALASAEWNFSPRLYGQFQLEFCAGQSAEGDAQWTAMMNCPPPRKAAKWLVWAYEGDGGNTLQSFSRPTAVRIAAAAELRGGRRSLGLAPLPKDVPWIQTARFVLKGIVPQALTAVSRLHDAGFAHRVLSPASFQLSTTQGMNKNVALETCDPSLLSLRLSDFGRATTLGLEADELVAQDRQALGLIILQVLLSALAEVKVIDPATGQYVAIPYPEFSVADLKRQIALFDGRVAGESGFAEFCRGEPAWSKVVALLDADDGAGWDFVQGLLSASPAVPEGGGSSSGADKRSSPLTTHPFLDAQNVENAIQAAAGGQGRQGLGGLFKFFGG